MSGTRNITVNNGECQEILRTIRSAEMTCTLMGNITPSIKPEEKHKDKPAPDEKPGIKERKLEMYPPIVTIDGRVDTDIDHLIEDLADDYHGPVVEVPSKYPKPHMFSVIEGSLDDDVDSFANDDGTMEHTLVDAPKTLSAKDLQDVVEAGGKKSPVFSKGASSKATDRSHNKMYVDPSEVETSINYLREGGRGCLSIMTSLEQLKVGKPSSENSLEMNYINCVQDMGKSGQDQDSRRAPFAELAQQKAISDSTREVHQSCSLNHRMQNSNLGRVKTKATKSDPNNVGSDLYSRLDGDFDAENGCPLNSRAGVVLNCECTACASEGSAYCSSRKECKQTESTGYIHAFTESLTCTLTDESFREGHLSLDPSVPMVNQDSSECGSETDSESYGEGTSGRRLDRLCKEYDHLGRHLDPHLERRLVHFVSQSEDSLNKCSDLYLSSGYYLTRVHPQVPPSQEKLDQISRTNDLANISSSDHAPRTVVTDTQNVINSTPISDSGKNSAEILKHEEENKSVNMKSSVVISDNVAIKPRANDERVSSDAPDATTKGDCQAEKCKPAVTESQCVPVSNPKPYAPKPRERKVEQSRVSDYNSSQQNTLPQPPVRLREELINRKSAHEFEQKNQQRSPTPNSPSPISCKVHFSDSTNLSLKEDSPASGRREKDKSPSRERGVQVKMERELEHESRMPKMNSEIKDSHSTPEKAGKPEKIQNKRVGELSDNGCKLIGLDLDTESLDSESYRLLQQLRIAQTSNRRTTTLLKHAHKIVGHCGEYGEIGSCYVATGQDLKAGRAGITGDQACGKMAVCEDVGQIKPNKANLEESPRTKISSAEGKSRNQQSSKYKDGAVSPGKELNSDLIEKRGLAQTRDSGVRIREKRFVETRDGGVLKNVDRGQLESRDISLLESRDISLLESRDISLLESRDISLLESRDISLLEKETRSLEQKIDRGILKKEERGLEKKRKSCVVEKGERGLEETGERCLERTKERGLEQTRERCLERTKDRGKEQTRNRGLMEKGEKGLEQTKHTGLEKTRDECMVKKEEKGHQQIRKKSQEQTRERGLDKTRERGLEQTRERGILKKEERGLEQKIDRGIEQTRERGIEQTRGIEQARERGIEQARERGIEQTRGIEQARERGIEQARERGIEQTRERGLEQTRERGLEQTRERGIEQTRERGIEQTRERGLEQTRERGIEQTRERGIEQTRERGIEQTRERGLEQTRERGIEQTRERGIEQARERGIEQTRERGIEQTRERGIEQTRERGIEQTRERGLEQTRGIEQARERGIEQARERGIEQTRERGLEQTRERGIEQTRERGIEQTRERGIEQTRERGIEQTRGIEQARERGIEQTRGIEQARERGIEQTRERGIEQTRERGIEQTRERGIEQTRERGIEQTRGIEQARERGIEQARERGIEQTRGIEQARERGIEQARERGIEQTRGIEQARERGIEQTRGIEQARERGIEQARERGIEQTRGIEQARERGIEQTRGIEQARERGIEQARERGIEQTRERGIEQARERGIEQTRERGIEQTRERGIEQTRERGIEQTRERGLEQTRERGLEQTRERGIEQARERGIEQTRERGIEHTRERGIEQARERGIEQARERGIEQTRERSIDKTRERGIEQTRERGLDQTRNRSPMRKVEKGLDKARKRGLEQTGYRDLEQTRYRDLEQAGYRDLEQAGYRDLEQTRYRDLEQAGYRDLEQAGYRDLEQAGYRDLEQTSDRGLEQAGYRDLEQAGYRDLEQTRYRDLEQTSDRGLKQAGYRDLKQAGYRDLEQARYRDLEQTRYRDLEQASDRGLKQAGYRDIEQAGYRDIEQAGDRGLEQRKDRFIEQTRDRDVLQRRDRYITQCGVLNTEEAGEIGLVRSLVSSWDKHCRHAIEDKVDHTLNPFSLLSHKNEQTETRSGTTNHGNTVGRESVRTSQVDERRVPLRHDPKKDNYLPRSEYEQRHVGGDNRRPQSRVSEVRERLNHADFKERARYFKNNEALEKSIEQGHGPRRESIEQRYGPRREVRSSVCYDSPGFTSDSSDTSLEYSRGSSMRIQDGKRYSNEVALEKRAVSVPRRVRNSHGPPRREGPDVSPCREAGKLKHRKDAGAKRSKHRSLSVKDSLRMAFKVAEQSITAAARVAEALSMVMQASQTSLASSSSAEHRYTTTSCTREPTNSKTARSKFVVSVPAVKTKSRPAADQFHTLKESPKQAHIKQEILGKSQTGSVKEMSESNQKKKHSSRGHSSSQERSSGCKTSLLSPSRKHTFSRNPRNDRVSHQQRKAQTALPEFKRTASQTSLTTLSEYSSHAWGDTSKTSTDINEQDKPQIIIQVACSNSPSCPLLLNKHVDKSVLQTQKQPGQDSGYICPGRKNRITFQSIKPTDEQNMPMLQSKQLTNSAVDGRGVENNNTVKPTALFDHRQSSKSTLSQSEWTIPHYCCSSGRNLDSYFTNIPPVIDQNLQSISLSTKKFLRRQMIGSCVDTGHVDSSGSDSIEFNSNFNKSIVAKQFHISLAHIEQQKDGILDQFIVNKCSEEYAMSQSHNQFLLLQQSDTLQNESESFPSEPNVFQRSSESFPSEPNVFQRSSESFPSEPNVFQRSSESFPSEPNVFQRSSESFPSEPNVFQCLKRNNKSTLSGSRDANEELAYRCLTRSHQESCTHRRETLHARDKRGTSYQLHEEAIVKIGDYFQSWSIKQEQPKFEATMSYTDASSPTSSYVDQQSEDAEFSFPDIDHQASKLDTTDNGVESNSLSTNEVCQLDITLPQKTDSDQLLSLAVEDTLNNEVSEDPPREQATQAPKPRTRKLQVADSGLFPFPGRTVQKRKFSPIVEEVWSEDDTELRQGNFILRANFLGLSQNTNNSIRHGGSDDKASDMTGQNGNAAATEPIVKQSLHKFESHWTESDSCHDDQEHRKQDGHSMSEIASLAEGKL